jgi:hypothetical protein
MAGMAEPTFTLRLLNAYNVIALSPPSVAGTLPAKAAKADAACIAMIKHRAEADARHLAVPWSIISRGPNGRG